MWAASAGPLSFANRSVHAMVALPPVSVTIALKVPPAPAGAPFGAGFSPLGTSDAANAVTVVAAAGAAKATGVASAQAINATGSSFFIESSLREPGMNAVRHPPPAGLQPV